MRLARLLPFIILVFSAPVAAQAPASFAGIWDLVWQTRHGPDASGYIVIEQQGSRLTAEIHGKGHVKAKGEAAGAAFILRGSRMAVPYTISGRLDGEALRGSLQILSLTKSFTGTRRRIN